MELLRRLISRRWLQQQPQRNNVAGNDWSMRQLIDFCHSSGSIAATTAAVDRSATTAGASATMELRSLISSRRWLQRQQRNNVDRSTDNPIDPDRRLKQQEQKNALIELIRANRAPPPLKRNTVILLFLLLYCYLYYCALPFVHTQACGNRIIIVGFVCLFVCLWCAV